MSGAALIDAIGIFGTALGLIGFIQDNLPGDKPPEGAAIKVKVGLEKGDDEGQLDGDLAAVYGWDTNNNYLGQGDGSYINHGDVFDTIVGQSVPGTRAEFVGLTGGNNAICIAWITINMKDTTTGGAWTGDIGSNCGQAWYESAEFAGYKDKNGPRDDANSYYPHCAWLDGDHTNDIPSASMKLRTLAYGEQVTDTINGGGACSNTIWGPDTGPITGAPGKRDLSTIDTVAKRTPDTWTRPQWVHERLVVSNVTQHEAKNMCNSETSWGPDFVSLKDGYFCDMSTKTLTPLCSTSNIDGCLNVNPVERSITKRTTVAKRSVNLAHKSYGKVTSWGQ